MDTAEDLRQDYIDDMTRVFKLTEEELREIEEEMSPRELAEIIMERIG